MQNMEQIEEECHGDNNKSTINQVFFKFYIHFSLNNVQYKEFMKFTSHFV